jgi:hypothetical protein
MSLFKKIEKETVLILDIGNGSVGGALAELTEGGQPKIFFSHREPITIQSERDSKQLLESMTKLLRRVIETVHKDGIAHADFKKHGKGRLHDIYCVFSSPWYVSQTKTIKIEKQKAFTVGKRFVEDIVTNEEKIFRASLLKGDYGHLFHGDVRVIEHHIIETKLNGYGVDAPYGKIAHNLELSLFTSIVSEEIIQAVEKEIHKHFNYKRCRFYSFALVSFSTIRDMYPNEQDFMFLDITGEVTDVSITRKNVLLETISFPLGRASLIRKLANVLNISPAVALSYVRLVNEGGLSPAMSEKIYRALEGFKREWCEYFKKSIQELSRDIMLPKTIYFTADADSAPYFETLMKQEKCVQFPDAEIENDGFTVSYLDQEKLKLFVVAGPQSSRDEFLTLESIFFNKVFASHASSNII